MGITNRRTFLTGIAVASIAAPAAAQTFVCATSPLEGALAEYRHARAEFERIAEFGDDDATTRAGGISDDAFEAMLKAPARNGADIATKLEILQFEYVDCVLDEERLHLIIVDARRLSGRV